MNILSLFDGISCGQIALQKANISYDKYYASEIDKYAIKITQKNYPDTIQLGDILNWKEWNLPTIDLIMGGSPCQGFSNAGAGLNFDDPRSKLFFVFVDILKYYKPKYFLLENVKMKKEWSDVITSYLEVEPIEINSALVSAQNRKRLYWTNIPNVTQPENKNLFIKDILEEKPNEKYIVRSGHAGYLKHINQKAGCLTGGAHSGGNHSDMTLLEVAGNIYPSKGQNGNVYFTSSKSPTILSGIGVIGRGIGSSNSPKILDAEKLRRLTPIECERLQTIPDNYTEGISNTQRYKTIGNGWTVDVIAHIFKEIKNDL